MDLVTRSYQEVKDLLTDDWSNDEFEQTVGDGEGQKYGSAGSEEKSWI